MKNSTTRTVSRSHFVTTVLDGNTGLCIVHTGEWVSGRDYLFSNGNSGNPKQEEIRFFIMVYICKLNIHQPMIQVMW